jgi:uncharacterized protein YciI
MKPFMKIVPLLITLIFISLTMSGQDRISNEVIMERVSKGKPFTLVFLRTGPKPPKDEQELGGLQMDHLAHLFGLEKAGKISIFGPISNDKEYHGIIVFNTSDFWQEAFSSIY